ncbi:MAG: hypothetical protein Alpg2KO_28780 [Alphaproteobacteria bacterium]
MSDDELDFDPDEVAEKALKRVEAVFKRGTLKDKLAELEGIIEDGDSTLFDGEVAWAVFFVGRDMRVSGTAENLDMGFADMVLALRRHTEEMGEDAEVQLAIEDLTDDELNPRTGHLN